ncbi:MAG: hypothetical protein HN368_09380 [Spirochaetales bacterium]|jgi:tetratricopeptide (TPR) repeat protein|nr:hypothetical protein [Spirochaetales bacterium]
MKNRVSYVPALAFLLISAASARSEIPAPTIEHYYSAYDSYLNGVVDSKEFDIPLEIFLSELRNFDDPVEAAYWRGRVSLLRGMAHIESGNHDDAERYLDEAVEIAEEMIAGLDTERGTCLKADAKGRILIIRGLPYKISHAGEVLKLAEIVLEINPENVRALLLVALRRVNAPKIFGGNPETGIEILERILSRPDIDETVSRQDQFWCLLALGEANAKAGRNNHARTHYQNALFMYPGNSEALALLGEL